MIVDNPYYHWIYIIPSNPDSPYMGKWEVPKTREEYLEHRGKWVIFDEKEYLDRLARMLDPYVEDRYINTIKYLRKAVYFWAGYNLPIMYVYCDDREREDVWQILRSIGVTHKEWIYERETMGYWMPGGILIEKLISYCKLSPEDGERLRRENQEKWEKWLSILFEKGEKLQNIWNFEQIWR